MIATHFMRPFPKKWVLKVLTAPYRGLELVLATLLLTPVMYLYMVISLCGYLTLRVFAFHPNQRTFEAWFAVRGIRNKALDLLLYEGDSYSSYVTFKQDLRVVLKHKPEAAYLMFPECVNPNFIATTYSILLEESTVESQGSFTKEQFSERRLIFLKAIHKGRAVIADHIMSADYPKSEEEEPEYVFSQPYSRFSQSYRTLLEILKTLSDEEYESNKHWIKETYNTLYRPTFHLHASVEGLDDILLPTYSMKYDTLDGYLYEGSLMRFRFEDYPSHIRSKLVEILGRENPETAALPEEWKIKIAEARLGEQIDNHISNAAWREHEFSTVALPRWAAYSEETFNVRRV